MRSKFFLASLMVSWAGSLTAQDSKPTEPGKGPWVTSIALGAGHDQCVLSSATGLLLQPGSVLKSSISDLSKTEKIGEVPAAAWKVVLIDNDKKAVVTDYSGGVHVGSLADPKSWKKLDAKLRWSRAMVATNDGRVIIGTEDGKLVPMKVEDSSLGTPVEAHKSAVFGLTLSEDGSKLLSASGEGVVKLWNVADMQMVREFQVGTQAVWGASFSEGGKSVVTADANRRVNLFQSETGKMVMSIGILPDWGTSVVSLPDDVVAVSALNGRVYLFDVKSRLKMTDVAGPGSGIWAMALCDDKKHLVVGTRSHGAAVMDSSQWQTALAETRKRAMEEQPPSP